MFRLFIRSLAIGTAVVSVGLVAPAQADSNGRAKVTQIVLPVGWRPEGITAGRKSTLYIGSLANGAIWKADARTGAGSILTPGVTGRVSVGVDFDKRTNRLWVAGGGTGEVRVIDAESGALLQTYPVPGAAGVGFLNDVVVTKGAVYVTDSRRSLLAVIALPKDRSLPPPSGVSILPLTGGATGNGIVSIDGSLIIVQSNIGVLFKVDPATGNATPINLGGYLVTNGDGLEPGGDGQLFVVRNRANLIAKLQLSDDLLSGQLVRELTNPNFDIPSTAALQRGQLWAVNARFGTAVPPETSTYSANAVDPGDDDDGDDDRDSDESD